MKIKLDENLPLSLCVSLESLGHDVHTTQQRGLQVKPIIKYGNSRKKKGAS